MLHILTMDEQTENYQGQQPRGRRGVMMHGDGCRGKTEEEAKDGGAYQMK